MGDDAADHRRGVGHRRGDDPAALRRVLWERGEDVAALDDLDLAREAARRRLLLDRAQAYGDLPPLADKPPGDGPREFPGATAPTSAAPIEADPPAPAAPALNSTVPVDLVVDVITDWGEPLQARVEVEATLPDGPAAPGAYTPAAPYEAMGHQAGTATVILPRLRREDWPEPPEGTP